MQRTVALIFACSALTLQLPAPTLAQAPGEGSSKPAETASSNTLNDPPSTYGYAGVRIDRDAKGFFFQAVEDGSPARKSGLQTNDRLERFKIDAPYVRIYKSLSKTITYNPNKTINVTISRAGAKLQIPLRVSSLQDCPNEEILKAKRAERKRDSEGVSYSQDLLVDAPEVPQVIEFFDSKTGPSSILLDKRLDGLKVLSLPLDDKGTQAKLKNLNLKIAPHVVAVDDYNGIVYPFPISSNWYANRDLFYTLDYEKPETGELAVIRDKDGRPVTREVQMILSQQEIALRNSKFDGWPAIVHTGLGQIIFDGRGGHLGPSIEPLIPLAHTWFYQNQNNFISNKDNELSQALQALVRQTVKALNANALDTKKASSKLTGEAKITGNSIKAGSEENPGLGKFLKLDENQIKVRLLSEACAVARVKHMPPGTESYFYIIDDDGWKVSAIRTPLEERKIAPGYDIDEPSIDENWNRLEAERIRNYTPAVKAALNASHDEQVRAARRSLMTDHEIRVWFKYHQAELNVLAKQSMTDLKLGEFTNYRQFSYNSLLPITGNPKVSISGRLKALELGAVQKPKENNVYLSYSNARYSESGVLYSEDNCPPPIGPYGTIWTEKLADHWYIMRVIDENQFPAIEAHQVPKPTVKPIP
ncbi:hypothetical protein KBI23_04185 [bacterium]|nr:hypothetical protein [bacterium]MBP9807303.1 hypothetical protein [bacterium]